MFRRLSGSPGYLRRKLHVLDYAGLTGPRVAGRPISLILKRCWVYPAALFFGQIARLALYLTAVSILATSEIGL
jgi:hypothetical protein